MSEDQPAQPSPIPRSYLAALGVVGTVGLLLIAPVDYPGRLLGVVFDYGHVPAFAILAFVVTRLLGGRTPPLRVAGTVAIAAVVFGVGAEFVQKHVGRSAELGDAFANAVGAAVGFLAATWNRWTRNQKRVASVLLTCGAVAAFWAPTQILIDINRQRNQFPMLGSFESELELSRWHTRKSSKRQSQVHASDGQSSLEWRLRPDQYPEIHTRWPFGDWGSFGRLEVDVWNPGEPMSVFVKIEDGHHNGQYEDRFQQEFPLQSGKTTIVVSMSDVESAPVGREMDMQAIARVSIFTIDLAEPRTLFLDRLQLAGPR